MSAFHLLKISPESSRAEIDNAHEDAGFDARIPEDVLQKAVDALTAPMPRLREEISYLWGILPPEIDQLIHSAKTDVDGGWVCKAMEKVSLPVLTKANLAMYFCAGGNASNANNLVDVLNILIEAQKHIDVTSVGEMINRARKKSGVVPVAKLKDIADALTKLREETYVKSAINVISHVQHPSELATEIAEEWRFDKTASGHLVVNLIRGAYKNRIQDVLRPLEQEIDRAADVLRGSPHNEKSLRLIEQKLLKWDEYAQPIQLIDEGKGFDEQHSSEICDKLRDLALYLHNEEDESRVSLRITKLLNKVFPELPEAAKRLAEDLDKLERIVNEKHQGAKIKERLQELTSAVDNIRDDPDKILNLVNAFTALLNNYAELANNGQIWNIVRSAAVALHNKHGATSSALNLTKKLLSLAKRFNAPQSIYEQFYEDEKSLSSLVPEELSILERFWATILSVIGFIFSVIGFIFWSAIIVAIIYSVFFD